MMKFLILLLFLASKSALSQSVPTEYVTSNIVFAFLGTSYGPFNVWSYTNTKCDDPDELANFGIKADHDITITRQDSDFNGLYTTCGSFEKTSGELGYNGC